MYAISPPLFPRYRVPLLALFSKSKLSCQRPDNHCPEKKSAPNIPLQTFDRPQNDLPASHIRKNSDKRSKAPRERVRHSLDSEADTSPSTKPSMRLLASNVPAQRPSGCMPAAHNTHACAVLPHPPTYSCRPQAASTYNL